MEGVKGPLAYYVRSSQYKCETICMIYNKCGNQPNKMLWFPRKGCNLFFKNKK